MADPDDELELEVDQPAEPDLEDEGLDTAEQGEDESDTSPPDQQPERQTRQDQDAESEPPARAPSRGENRIQTLRNELRERDRQIAETNRRVDELLRERQRPTGETPEQRAARHALMTPQEIMGEQLRESEGRMAQQIQSLQFQNLETADRTAFQAKAAVDPLYAKWGPKVEGKLAELRARGQSAEREVILKFLIGEAALARRGTKEGRREVRQAERRVQGQRVRPSNSGSDTSADRRQQGGLERRLENVQI